VGSKSTFEVDVAHEGLLSIGDLAERTGVARSALRYYGELGLLQPTARQSGQRRYNEGAVAVVGVILLLQDAGFSLGEIRQIMRPGPARPGSVLWRDLAASKIKELDDRIAKAQAARSALGHAVAHHHDDDLLDCPQFLDGVTSALQGVPLRASHPH
jgi:MerR family transcriptional regulator, copper efflux regulator